MTTRTSWLVVLCVVAACSKSPHHVSAANAAQLIATAHGLADRMCACKAERACAYAVRDDFDAQKPTLLHQRLLPADQAAFDVELQRLRGCGDGAGVTIWLNP